MTNTRTIAFFPARRYWHIYGGEIERFGAKGWHSIVTGPSEYAVPVTEEPIPGVKWIQTLARNPSADDLAQHMPEEYRK